MRPLSLQAEPGRGLRILCLGAHSDDIEIGCGGTLLRLLTEQPLSSVHWVVFSAGGVRAGEARAGARLFAGAACPGGPLLKEFPDGFMPYVGDQIKPVFEELKMSLSPDVIFTHNRADAHQDHRLLAELTWNTFRNHLVLEYEIPKYDGDMGRPGFFVPLPRELCHRKVDFLMEAFASQQPKRWFEPETFFSLLRLRGMECNSPTGYAEAFYCRKVIL